jgi:hypothetical protein
MGEEVRQKNHEITSHVKYHFLIHCINNNYEENKHNLLACIIKCIVYMRCFGGFFVGFFWGGGVCLFCFFVEKWVKRHTVKVI